MPNNMDTFLSVIVPAHNEEDYIEKTLISITNSSYKNYELIVVCDSCSDRTAEISKKYTQKVYSVDYKNTSQTRNYGASKGNGGIIVFSDADTICSNDYLASVVKAINAGGDYGCSKITSETGTWKGWFMIGRIDRYFRMSKSFGGNFFVRKDFFVKTNGFDENMIKGEDTDLADRLYGSGAKFFYIKDSYVITSERRFQKYGYFHYYINSVKEALLYFFNKSKYKEVFRRKEGGY